MIRAYEFRLLDGSIECHVVDVFPPPKLWEIAFPASVPESLALANLRAAGLTPIARVVFERKERFHPSYDEMTEEQLERYHHRWYYEEKRR